jgi:serine protease Do
MRITTRFLTLLLLFFVAASGIGFWYIYRECSAMRCLLGSQSIGQQSCEQAQCQKAHESVGLQQKPVCWRDVQDIAKDTVVQIFSSIAQFNWAEPYKTPQTFQATGTAFFISSEGELFTNAHVVDQAKKVTIQIPSRGKRRYDVDIIGVSIERDLALLKLTKESFDILKASGGIRTINLGDSDSVYRADNVMALGYPLGQQFLKSTTGVVSGREVIDGHYMIQISAPINPGNSGGPLVNMCGEVLGINTVKTVGTEGIGYITPVNEAKLFLKQLRDEQKKKTDNANIILLRKPFLGILFTNASDYLTEFLHNPKPGGLYIVETYKGSPLARAGILPGDMIYEIDGYRIDEYGEISVSWCEDKISISAYVGRLHIGDKIKLVIYRSGKRKEISLTFDASELAPVRAMYPAYEKIDYEVFAGMVVMPLTLNHLALFIQYSPELARYAEFKNQLEAALVITHVFPESILAQTRTFGVGAIVSEVNGKKVKTVYDYRDALELSKKTGFITIKTTENVFVVLPLSEVLKQEAALQSTYFYPPSTLMQTLGSGPEKTTGPSK